jgi:uncharacterized protein YecA (UPF0149 family)
MEKQDIGIIGHTDHGKATLVDALTTLMSGESDILSNPEHEEVFMEITNTHQHFEETLLWGENGPTATHPIRTTPKIGRNENCPCGTGKKYKKCCINK